MEPLKTDEPLPPHFKKHKNDFESQILGGCGTFVAGSITTYFLSIWPFLVFQDLANFSILMTSILAGLLPGFLFGLFLCRKGGLAGACGFCGGALTVSVFLYLRFEQTVISELTKQGPKMEFPHYLGWLIPLLWGLAAVGTTLAALPKSELSLK